jgi:curved DNA binding protein
VATLCVPDADIADICDKGDKFIEEEIKKVYNNKKAKKLERGVAYPTCINVNSITLNYSPLKDESTVLKEGDIAKLDLGCHLDGYFTHVGTTVIVSADPTKKYEGPIANLLVAGNTALQAAIRSTIAGNTNEDVTNVIEKVSKEFNLTPIDGTYSHKHKKHMMEEKAIIMNRRNPEKKQELYTFEKGDVFGLDIYLATGEGKCKLTDLRTTVYKRALENTYILKSDAARKFFSEINSRFPSLPFSLRSFENTTTAKLGVKHCLDHELLEPFEVHTLKDGELGVSFKATIAILEGGTQVIAGNKIFNADLYASDTSV